MKSNSFLQKRQTKYGAYFAAYTLVVIAVLVLANWAATRYGKSWDLTSNKRYSLSDQTKKIVRELKSPVQVYYFDKQSRFRAAKDLLSQYDHLSPKLSIDYIDPDRNPQKARELQVKSYGSIVLTAGDRRQEANVLDEESVTTALIRVVKSGTKSVCFVEGHGELDPESSDRQGLSRAKKALEDSNYTVKSISLLREAKVPQDCTVVAVDGPKNDYVDTETDAIKKFVDGGGRALFLIDPENSAEKLSAMLADWNVVLKKDLVIDLNPVNQLFGASEAMPIITSYKSHPITREMTRVATIMPMARTVDPGKESKAGITTESLFETSAESWSTDYTPGAKSVKFDQKKDMKGPLSLAVAGTVSTQPGAPDPSKAAAQGRFAVFGSARFPANAYIGFNGNKDLFVNTVNWLASDEDLISIRPKEPENRRVNLSIAQMRGVFYLSVIFLPLALVFGGVAVWWKRR